MVLMSGQSYVYVHLAFCEPPQLTNGYLEFSDNNGEHDVKSTVTYHCDQGFELSDDKWKTRRCQENRKWSGTAPTCSRKYFTKMLSKQYFLQHLL